MHELSVAQALVNQVCVIALAERAEHVETVTLSVGALSGIDPEALKMAFPLAAEGTAAHDATLVIETVRAAGTCRGCGNAVEPDFPFLICPQCGSTDVELLVGRELSITSLEVVCGEEPPLPPVAVKRDPPGPREATRSRTMEGPVPPGPGTPR